MTTMVASGDALPAKGEPGLPNLERLSALIDGEIEAADAAASCRHWSGEAECRGRWHEYHVIGDVLRSEELAAGASGDAAFLAALRARLAEEPVVLAPAPLPAAAFAVRRRSFSRRWMLPSAAAAGFVLVAGTFIATRPGGIGPSRPAELSAAAPAAAIQPASLRAASAEPIARASGRLIRDARLDRYLAAHKQFAGSTAPALPPAMLRNASIEVEGR